MSKQVTKTVTVRPKAASAVRNVVRTVIVSKPGIKKSSRRRSKPNKQGYESSMNLFAKDYAKCLCDPFNEAPYGVGLGTLIPTKTATAYQRGNLTTNADGSFQIVLNPSLVNISSTSSGGGAFIAINSASVSATPTWTTLAGPANQTSLSADYDQLRCLAGGLRILPDQSFSNNPGMLFAGIIAPGPTDPPESSAASVPGSTGALNNFSTTAVMGLPTMEMYRGYNSIEVDWRPSELADFDFDAFNITSINAPCQVPVLLVAGVGYPASSLLYYDAVFHYEGYDTQKVSSANNGYAAESEMTARTAGYPSVDSLWQKSTKYIGSATRVIGELYQSAEIGREMWAGAKKTYGGLFPTNRHIKALPYYNHRADVSTVDIVRSKKDEDEKKQGNVPPVTSTPPPTSSVGRWLG